MSEETITSLRTQVLVIDEEIGQFNVNACLIYRRQDPYAVQMLFTEHGEVNPWMLSRDVLIDCVVLGKTAGEGDFVIAPNDSYPVTDFLGNPQETCLMHITGHGDLNRSSHAHGIIRTAFLREFLNDTLRLVPQGMENEHYDIDALIKELTSADD